MKQRNAVGGKRTLCKKALLLLTVFLLAISACVGCASSQGEAPTQEDASVQTITDAAGRTLQIPEDHEGQTIASVYAVSVPFLVALELDEQVVAINTKTKFFPENLPAIDAAGTVGRGAVDLEALATFAPSVLIHRSNDPKTVEQVEQLGIDIFCIRAESMDDVVEMLTLLGKYFGKEERAAEVIAFIEGKFAYIDSIVAQIPIEERPVALLMGGQIGRIAGIDMIQSWMIEKAGGIAAPKDITNNCNWINVGAEKVFEYNPEYLFLTGSTSLEYEVEELLKDPSWSAVEAIKNDRVWQVPSKKDCWDMPGVASVLGTMWMLNKMHPEYFSTEQLRKEIDEYYTFFLGKTFEEDYLGYTL